LHIRQHDLNKILQIGVVKEDGQGILKNGVLPLSCQRKSQEVI
jgi:hypothetical protein